MLFSYSWLIFNIFMFQEGWFFSVILFSNQDHPWTSYDICIVVYLLITWQCIPLLCISLTKMFTLDFFSIFFIICFWVVSFTYLLFHTKFKRNCALFFLHFLLPIVKIITWRVVLWNYVNIVCIVHFHSHFFYFRYTWCFCFFTWRNFAWLPQTI